MPERHALRRTPGASAAQRVAASPRAALIARAKSLELDTPYVPPPGDPLEHHTAGFAKIMCSAVFITGLDPDFAAENVGYFTGPYLERAKVGKPVIDRAAKTVRVTMPNGVTLHGEVPRQPGMRHAAGRAAHGELHAGPGDERAARSVDPAVADGRRAAGRARFPPDLDAAKLKQAVDAAFEPGRR